MKNEGRLTSVVSFYQKDSEDREGKREGVFSYHGGKVLYAFRLAMANRKKLILFEVYIGKRRLVTWK